MAGIYESITDTIGKTPLVRLNKLGADTGAEILAKLEFFNPGASVKDRLGIAIIEAAEASGELKPGGTIVEGTSGNTGVGLALVAAARGYKAIFTMPESASLERRALFRYLGAELILTPAAEGMKTAVARATEIAAETEGAVLARQFENEANVAYHRKTTAEEIWADTEGAVDIYVAGVGTGGTLTGVGQVLKERNPEVKVVAVEPLDSPILNGGAPGPHKIQGIGPNFIPGVLDREVYDEVIDVPTEEAIATARALATEEGIVAGISAGAIIWSAIEIAKRPESAGKRIVAIVPDTGERYISTPLFEGLRD